jgi:hypothetical protein
LSEARSETDGIARAFVANTGCLPPLEGDRPGGEAALAETRPTTPNSAKPISAVVDIDRRYDLFISISLLAWETRRERSAEP